MDPTRGFRELLEVCDSDATILTAAATTTTTTTTTVDDDDDDDDDNNNDNGITTVGLGKRRGKRGNNEDDDDDDNGNNGGYGGSGNSPLSAVNIELESVPIISRYMTRKRGEVFQPINRVDPEDARALRKREARTIIEKRVYHPKRLNAQQRVIYDHVMNNRQDIVLLQAGPGTGKTFTMLTLAHAMNHTMSVIAMIYKHDLLRRFEQCAATTTVVSFCMKVLGIGFGQYQALEMQLSRSMDPHKFFACVEGLLRRAVLPEELCVTPMQPPIFIIDEYTVIPKPMLFMLLLLLRRHSIGVVVCGDYNQLQNIHNSIHMRDSSYHLVASFADRIFSMNRNERCVDSSYNDLINYLALYSSSSRIDRYGYAMLTAIFYRKFSGRQSLYNTILASHHRELTSTVHMLVQNNQIPVSFYYIDVSSVRQLDRVRGVRMPNGLYVPSPVQEYITHSTNQEFHKIFQLKHLVYLPLILNGLYFLNEYSDYKMVRLLEIRFKDGTTYDPRVHRFVDENSLESLIVERVPFDSGYTMRNDDDDDDNGDNEGKERIARDAADDDEDYDDDRKDRDAMGCSRVNARRIKVKRGKCNDVLFEGHKDFLLGKGLPGNLYNFPLSLANSMSIHMAQGRTIKSPLHLILNSTTYQGAYVAASRVQSPRDIVYVSVPNVISNLISVIVNFQELCDNTAPDYMLTPSQLHAGMSSFTYYSVERFIQEFTVLAAKFFESDDPSVRRHVRAFILRRLEAERLPSDVLSPPDKIHFNVNNSCYDNGIIGSDRRRLRRPCYGNGVNNNDEGRTLSAVVAKTASSPSTSSLSPISAMSLMLRHKNTLFALSRVHATDAVIWLNEFMRVNIRARALCDRHSCDYRNVRADDQEMDARTLYQLAQLDRFYTSRMNVNAGVTVEYIKSRARFAVKRPTEEKNEDDRDDADDDAEAVYERTRRRNFANLMKLRRKMGDRHRDHVPNSQGVFFDREVPQYRIETFENDMVLETTRFQRALYRRLTALDQQQQQQQQQRQRPPERQSQRKGKGDVGANNCFNDDDDSFYRCREEADDGRRRSAINANGANEIDADNYRAKMSRWRINNNDDDDGGGGGGNGDDDDAGKSSRIGGGGSCVNKSAGGNNDYDNDNNDERRRRCVNMRWLIVHLWLMLNDLNEEGQQIGEEAKERGKVKKSGGGSGGGGRSDSGRRRNKKLKSATTGVSPLICIKRPGRSIDSMNDLVSTIAR